MKKQLMQACDLIKQAKLNLKENKFNVEYIFDEIIEMLHFVCGYIEGAAENKTETALPKAQPDDLNS